MRVAVTLASMLGIACVVGLGCSQEPERPPLFEGSNGGAGSPTIPSEPECEPPPSVDTSDTCGEETVSLFRRRPTIYFILDVSGSMADRVADGDDVKLDAAKEALIAVAQDIGSRAKYGLAVFPIIEEDADPDSAALIGCAPGEEIFPIQAGDPVECINRPPGGPVLSSFKRIVSSLDALGGTPLSATLEGLTPTLTAQAQEGTTAAILITDGSPNCNNDAECDVDECTLNTSGASILDEHQNVLACDDSLNCCDPDQVGDLVSFPRSRCADISESESKLSALFNDGVPTYVVGVLGSEDFDLAMNRLAIAGGRAREGERAYYDVASLEDLTSTVRAIGLDLAQTCEIELMERPLYANELNVYFDAELVPSDEENGWTVEEDLVTLHGDACTRVKSGEVEEVQLLSGCQTIVR